MHIRVDDAAWEPIPKPRFFVVVAFMSHVILEVLSMLGLEALVVLLTTDSQVSVYHTVIEQCPCISTGLQL